MQDTVSVNNRTKEIVQRCRKRMSTYTQAQREALNEVVTAYLGLSAAYQQDNKPEGVTKFP